MTQSNDGTQDLAKATAKMTASELDNILYQLLSDYERQRGTTPVTAKEFIKPARTQIQGYIDKQIRDGRRDQIMQDFLSLTVEVTDPEEHLIEWRDNQLKELEAGSVRAKPLTHSKRELKAGEEK